MTETYPSFSDQIEANKGAEIVPDATTTLEIPANSRLTIRSRGCFVTDYSVIDKLSGETIKLLYSDPDLTTSKLTASHVMSPVGPSEGIGGQHGFPRWADYQQYPQADGPDGDKRTTFQAKRSDLGLGVSKIFELGRDHLTTETTMVNSESTDALTSLGEHLYFTLDDEVVDGLRVNGQSLDQLLGPGTEAAVMSGQAYFWPTPTNPVEIEFPSGHSLTLQAELSSKQPTTLGMLIWHRPGSPSICFEPTAGFNSSQHNTELAIGPHQSITLTTRIELLGVDARPHES